MGGSGGGGGSSGKVDFPAYMKTFHGKALDNNGLDSVNVSLADAMNYAMDGNSPYAGFVTLSAEDAMLGAGKVITDFTAPFAQLVAYGALDFDTLFEDYKVNTNLAEYNASKAARLEAIFDAESALLDDEINISTLPQFQAGMRDVNAVMSSAFVIGTANIWDTKTKALAKNDAIIRWEAEKLSADLAIKADQLADQLAVHALEMKKQLVTITADLTKLYAVMRSEMDDFELETRAKDLLWDVKVFQYGGNFLGSISGSALPVDRGESGKNKLAGGLSGALGGAAMGASFGPWGAGIGAVAGGLAGAFL